MRRALLIALLVTTSAASAAEKWYDAYKRGVSAVNAKGYKAGADALQKAIAEMPNEDQGVRAGREIIVYVPHFWLGIALFNLGDVDGSLREWRISEDQGVITRTEYYARMKDWVSRAQIEKQRNAQSEASGPKKEADAAISKALAMQVDALSAGGDRSDNYRAAQRKLQEALSQFHAAGASVSAYQAAEATAQQATALFTAAADEGKKQRVARQTAPVVPKSQPQTKPPVVITNIPFDDEPPAKKTEKTETAPPPPPVESEAEVAARVAVQDYRRGAGQAPKEIARTETREADRLRRELDAAKSDADFERIGSEARNRAASMAKAIQTIQTPQPVTPPVIPAATVTTSTAVAEAPLPDMKPDLSGAFRRYAVGDLSGADAALSRMIDLRPTPEAYLLRGCVRYTQAMLARTSEPLLKQATADFKTALRNDHRLRLDRRAFSPKLVAFFEEIRKAGL